MKKVKKKDDSRLEKIKLYSGLVALITALVGLVAQALKLFQ